MAISTNRKPTIYRNLYENTAPARDLNAQVCDHELYAILDRSLNIGLKRHNQAKLIKKSVFLFRLLNVTIIMM